MSENTTTEIRSTNTVSSEQGILTKVTNKALLLSTLFIVVVVLVSLFSYFTQKNNDVNQKSNGNNDAISEKIREKNILLQNKKVLETFTSNTTAENQLVYKSNVDKLLEDKTLSEESRNSLLLRKAVTLSVWRGEGDKNTNWLESHKIFVDFIDTIPFNDKNTTAAQDYIRDYSIVGYVNQFTQCCRVDTATKSTHVQKILASEKAKGYNDSLAGLMTMHTLLKEVSMNTRDDLKYVSQYLFVDSLIISQQREGLTADDLKDVTSTLKDKLDMFAYTVPRTYNDPITRGAESKAYYAFAYDTYYSVIKSPNKESNTKIDDNYKAVYTLIDEELVVKGNPVSLTIMRVITSARFLPSMERRYGKNIDQKYFNEEVKNTFKSIESSPDTKAFADSQFKSYKNYELGYFVYLAKRNTTVAEYMKTIGIDPATVK